jgi:myo-inositol-1(or 4)-monophosphatase
VMRWFRQKLHVREKAPGDPLTEADLAADALIKEIVMTARPDDGWLSEETVDHPDRLVRERVWVVDPLDGTRSFIAGRAEFSISIALTEGGRAVVSVVYNPASGELFHAVAGQGAYLRDDRTGETSRLRVTAEAGVPPVLLASRSEIVAGELDPFRDAWAVRPSGSTAYKLARVAAGAADAFASRGPKSEWDVCAGGLIVEEAGGRVTDLTGAPLCYNQPMPHVYGILASNGWVHDRLLGVLAGLSPVTRMGGG